MAHYAIGDIQGCFAELQALLADIGFNPGCDTLWLTGDLVNRGPQSLAVLRWAYAHAGCVQTVLGNHDLHLLAVAYGHGRLKKGDTLAEVLQAPDCRRLLDWLRRQPLLLGNDAYWLVHAGLWPQWDSDTVVARTAEVAAALAAPDPTVLLAQMYGNTPDKDKGGLSTIERLRFTVNSCTRMRAIEQRGQMDFGFKSTLAAMPENLQPWFCHPHRRSDGKQVLFGHWSALGLYRGNGVIGLDTGALWGGSLSAIDLDSGAIWQTPSQTALNWAK